MARRKNETLEEILTRLEEAEKEYQRKLEEVDLSSLIDREEQRRNKSAH